MEVESQTEAARTPAEWESIELGHQLSVVMCWRQGKRLSARRLEISKGLAEQLRGFGRKALSIIGGRHPRPYEPSAALAPDEAFLFRSKDLPRRAVRTRKAEDEETQQEVASALFELVSRPAALHPLNLSDAKGHPFLFHAITVGVSGDTPVAFIRKHNSAQLVRGGNLLMQFGQEAKRLERDVSTLDRYTDLVIQGDHIAALREGIVAELFADVEVAAAAVPALVDRLGETCPLPLTMEARQALLGACSGRRSLARKLHKLLDSPHLATLTTEQLHRYLTSMGRDASDYLVDGQLHVADASPRAADALIEILGQQWYRAGLDEELRRAERSSRLEG